jgi:hypothetical protein
MLFTTLAAITFGGLSYAGSLLADLFYSAAVAMILIGLVAALVRKGPKRAFWTGFAVAAVAYMWLTLYPAETVKEYLVLMNNPRVTRFAYGHMNLVTTRLLAKSYGWFEDAPMSGVGGYSAADYMDRFVAYMVIGHCSLAMLLASAFGVLARALYQPATTLSEKLNASA